MLTSLANVASNITSIGTWFFGLFEDFFGIIADNPILLWSLILTVVSAGIMMVVKVLRKFGLKGKR